MLTFPADPGLRRPHGYPAPVTETLLGGRYRLDEPIGRGGMAAVWRATDTVLGREVAVKRLHAGLVSDEELIERFRREALLVARLSHPNLVHVLDRGDDAEGPYLVMELVEGENLKDRIRRVGALRPEEASTLCLQVALALSHAHGQGVIHRDIKAQNVLLTADGQAKLADFGIARMIEAEAESGLTRTDMMVGSADYLSPEQADGRPVDGRTDVYSLGIVLYECLTGRLPFVGDSFVAVAMKQCREALPDPRAISPNVPSWLAVHCMRAAEKDPAQRFPSAAAFAAALEAGPDLGGGTAVMSLPLRPATDEGETARTPRRRRIRRRRILGAVAVLLTLAAVGTGVGLYLSSPESVPPVTTPAAPIPLTITAVADLDPFGDDGSENPDQIALVNDGNDDTAWYTERYQDTPEFGGLKEGVGLALTLSAPAIATQAVVMSPTPGARFEIRGPGARPDGAVLGGGVFTGVRQTVPLRRAAAGDRYVLWITSLAADDSGRFHAGVSTVQLRGEPAED